MTLLDTLPALIFQGFRNKLRGATLWRSADSVSGGLDANGDPIATSVTEYPCQGFTDRYSDYFTKGGMVPETDVKVCIFGASLPAGVQPQKDDKVYIDGAWWQLRNPTTDPAQALWTCGAYECKAPA